MIMTVYMKDDYYKTKIQPGETLALSDGEVYVCAYVVDVDNCHYLYLVNKGKSGDVSFAEQRETDLRFIVDPSEKRKLLAVFNEAITNEYSLNGGGDV